jgi:hypothetical protein
MKKEQKKMVVVAGEGIVNLDFILYHAFFVINDTQILFLGC